MSHDLSVPNGIARTKILLSLLGASTLIMGYQFTRPSFVSCFVDDSILHISWCSQFQQALREGTWVPRWLPLANGGYGSPVFVFYSPLIYYVTALLGWLLPSIVTAMKVVKLLGFFLSGWTFYLFAARSLRQRRGALAAALLYQLLPYHVLDNYYWTFYAETWAWVWFPLILYFLTRCFAEPNDGRMYVGLAVAYSCLILTHLVSAFMFSFVVAAFVLWQGRRVPKECWLRLGLAAAASFGLSAYYLVPMLYERRFVHIDQIQKLVDFHNTFVFFPNAVVHEHYRFFLNIILLLQWVTAFQLLLTASSFWKMWGGKQTRPILFSFFAGLAVVCSILTTELTLWVWKIVPGLAQIQFPMRWLAFMTLGAAFVVGMALTADSKQPSTSATAKIQAFLFACGILGCGLLSLVIVANSCFLEERANQLAFQHAYNATEYNPKWTPNPENRLRPQEEPPFRLLSGQGEVMLEKWHAHARVIRYRADGPLLLRLRLFDYPGWAVYLDGTRLEVQRENHSGAIVTSLPPGEHLVEARFEDTHWRRWAKVISFISLIGCALVCRFSKDKLATDPGCHSLESVCS